MNDFSLFGKYAKDLSAVTLFLLIIEYLALFLYMLKALWVHFGIPGYKHLREIIYCLFVMLTCGIRVIFLMLSPANQPDYIYIIIDSASFFTSLTAFSSVAYNWVYILICCKFDRTESHRLNLTQHARIFFILANVLIYSIYIALITLFRLNIQLHFIGTNLSSTLHLYGGISAILMQGILLIAGYKLIKVISPFTSLSPNKLIFLVLVSLALLSYRLGILITFLSAPDLFINVLESDIEGFLLSLHLNLIDILPFYTFYSSVKLWHRVLNKSYVDSYCLIINQLNMNDQISLEHT
jgi:hypothetical protein